jgi:hypothetical protein
MSYLTTPLLDPTREEENATTTKDANLSTTTEESTFSR